MRKSKKQKRNLAFAFKEQPLDGQENQLKAFFKRNWSG